MYRLLMFVFMALIGWLSYSTYRTHFQAPRAVEHVPSSANWGGSSAGSGFKCDGRKFCSQMTSCAEATYFLRNCPGTKMDGDGDGIPCERQLCGG
jgi:hypothetical protein